MVTVQVKRTGVKRVRWKVTAEVVDCDLVDEVQGWIYAKHRIVTSSQSRGLCVRGCVASITYIAIQWHTSTQVSQQVPLYLDIGTVRKWCIQSINPASQQIAQFYPS